MDKIKVGILGCANIAIRSLIPEFDKHPDFELYAISSRDKLKVNPVASQYQIKAFDYEQLIEDSHIDLVYIPLPTGLHKHWVIKALKQGKHVLCEKSLGTSLTEVQEMLHTAQENKKALIENFQFQYHSQQCFIRNVIRQGDLGEIRCFRSSFGFPPFNDIHNIRYKKDLGGGALLDAGAYTLKAVQFFMEDSFNVHAAKSIIPCNSEVDIYGGAFLESNSGIIAEVAFGFDNFYQCNVEIWGSKGKLIADRVFTAPPRFQPEIIIEKSDGKKTYQLESDNHFKKMLDHVAQSVYSKEFENDYKLNYEQALLIQQFMDIDNGKRK
jgi:predicted dehydrogenase